MSIDKDKFYQHWKSKTPPTTDVEWMDLIDACLHVAELPRTFTQEDVWLAAQAMSEDTLIEGEADSIKFYYLAKTALEAVGKVES